VTVIDYGMGNLFSVARAFEHEGADVDLTSDPERVGEAERLVLPGVGAFGDGITGLRDRGLVEPILAHVERERPLLGICLGMHLLMDEGAEFGRHSGLGVVPGRARALDGADAKVPHIGWSEIERDTSWEGTVLDGLEDGSAMYFAHSFVSEPADDVVRLAETPFGESRFTSAFRRGPVHGTQFHPEKSGVAGLRLLRNFLEAA
jgi:glutamine amidotransferase